MLAPILCLVLTQAPAGIDPLALQRALSLAGSDGASAQEWLLEHPDVALPALSVVLRAQGASAVDRVITDTLRCSRAMSMFGPSRPGAATPAQRAAEVLQAMLAKDEAARVRFAQSGSPAELFVALISVWNDDAAAERLAKQMEVSTFDESDWQLARQLSTCAVMSGQGHPRRAAVMGQLVSRMQNGTCSSADNARAFAKRQGKPQLQGWSADGRDLHAQLTFGAAHVEANAECLLALFDVVNDPDLLTPLTQNHLREEEALDRLERALPKLAAAARARALVTLIGGGRQARHLKTFSEDDLARNEALLRGAVRARDPRAERILLQHLQCPFSDGEVALLTALADKSKATGEAKRLLDCPSAGGAAALALADLGDSSWVEHAPALSKNPFSVFKLQTAFDQHWSPALEATLRAVKSDDAEFNRWRDELISRHR